VKLIDKISKSAEYQLSEKDVKFMYKMDNFQWVTADEARIEQILIIMLSNAVKFTDKGKIQLNIFEENGLIIEINDTGIGIPEKKQKSVFELMHQVDNPLTKSYRGIGAGLPIVKLLAELMKRTISLTSSPGKGTSVKVFLPVIIEKSRKKDLSDLKNRPRVKNKILLVEDEAINRMYLTLILKKKGFIVIEAPDGAKALTAFKEEEIHLILMDIGLPGMNGIETTERIKNTNRFINNAVPVIAVTANTQQDIRQKCLNAGMYDIVSKPVDEKRLFNSIESALDSFTT